jgi:hypothetical protein
MTTIEEYCKAIEDGEITPVTASDYPMLLPTPTTPFMVPTEMAKYNHVLETPGAYTDWIAHSGLYYRFLLLNSARHGRHVVVWYNDNNGSLNSYFGTLNAKPEYRF